MRIFAAIILSMLMTFPAWAMGDLPGIQDALLNRVSLRLSAEQYVTTKSALVTVGVNAGVNDTGLEKIQDAVLKKLNGLSGAGEWHITSFDRSQDQSGLEKVVISAQARLPSSALVGLRDKTKSMSKPGETYTLDNVEFTPSEDEIRAANISLRGMVYQQAKDEVDRLNKMYPDQKYYIHNIDFVGNLITPQPIMPMMQMNMSRAAVASASAPGLAVGNKVELSAIVVLASMTDHGLIKNIT
ncbi:MAG: hypothetical protein P4M14_06670 [Gammaproteobacteria bacterium]|nr:hypothetical protein [Gammaproteobacteria bacterium]